LPQYLYASYTSAKSLIAIGFSSEVQKSLTLAEEFTNGKCDNSTISFIAGDIIVVEGSTVGEGWMNRRGVYSALASMACYPPTM